MSTENLGFFYGGAPGKNLTIQKTMSNATSLILDLSLGYGSDIKIGDYVLVSYGDYYSGTNINPVYQSNLDIDKTSVNYADISKLSAKNYNATLWYKYYDSTIDANAIVAENSDIVVNYTSKIGYKKIMHLSGPTPIISIGNTKELSPKFSPLVEENIDNIDRPEFTFSLPRSVNFYSTYDILNANNPLNNSANIIHGHFDGNNFYQATLQTTTDGGYYHDIVTDVHYNKTSAGMIITSANVSYNDGYVKNDLFYTASLITGDSDKIYYDIYSLSYYLYRQNFVQYQEMNRNINLFFGYYNALDNRCYLSKVFTLKNDITDKLSESTWLLDLNTKKIYYKDKNTSTLLARPNSTGTYSDSVLKIEDASNGTTTYQCNPLLLGYYNSNDFCFYNNDSYGKDNLIESRDDYLYIDRNTLSVYNYKSNVMNKLEEVVSGYYDSIKNVLYSDSLFTQPIDIIFEGAIVFNLANCDWYSASTLSFRGPYTISTMNNINQLLINKYFYKNINFDNLQGTISVPTSVINSANITFKEKDCYVDNIKYGLIFECTSINESVAQFVYKSRLRLSYPAVEIQSLPYYKTSNKDDFELNYPKIQIQSSNDIGENVVYNLVNLPNLTVTSNVTTENSSASMTKIDNSNIAINLALQRGNRFIGMYVNSETVSAYSNGTFTNFVNLNGPMVGDLYYNTTDNKFYQLTNINANALTWIEISGSITSAIKIDYNRVTSSSLASFAPDTSDTNNTNTIAATSSTVGKTCLCTYISSETKGLTSDLYIGISTTVNDTTTYSWSNCGSITSDISPKNDYVLNPAEASTPVSTFYNTRYINALEDRIKALEKTLQLIQN